MILEILCLIWTEEHGSARVNALKTHIYFVCEDYSEQSIKPKNHFRKKKIFWTPLFTTLLPNLSREKIDINSEKCTEYGK